MTGNMPGGAEVRGVSEPGISEAEPRAQRSPGGRPSEESTRLLRRPLARTWAFGTWPIGLALPTSVSLSSTEQCLAHSHELSVILVTLVVIQ